MKRSLLTHYALRRGTELNHEILKYNDKQEADHQLLCDVLANEIRLALREAEEKVWHGHPVWFLNDNPIVGYSKQKQGIRLMFWSGADFAEPQLNVVGAKFKDASIFFNRATEIDITLLRRWLECAKLIQWDYKNIVRRKGKLERLK